MPEFVPELVGELRPIPLADVDYGPCHAAGVRMQPDGGRTGCVLLDTQSRRLAIGEKAHTVEAGLPHAFDDQNGSAFKHAAPIAGEFYRGSEKRRRGRNWG
ncbi:hypothetical protein [Mesorhizobium sp.]|uniref:hypothetical protein n=1 Tax=Mesorhizobium sp. TaxID=1871066 RepID=UPI0025C0B8D4|nr:hypothetical protein [Mesorhizobium sp.]